MPEPKQPKTTPDKNKLKRSSQTSDDRAAKKRVVAPGAQRWVAPAFVTVGLLGVAWLVVYYIAGRDVAFMNKLGDWNILIGMGLMATALGLSMLWK